MVIYRDDALTADWIACHKCGFAGDAIELAARIWQLPIDETVRRLQQEGAFIGDIVTGSRLESYLRDHINLRRRVNEFWEMANQDLFGCHPASLLRMQQTAQISRYQTGWHRGCELVGRATRQAIEDLFVPGAMASRLRLTPKGDRTVRRGSGAGPRRPLPGKGWDTALVVPLYDVPGRICGFLFGQSPDDPEITKWQSRFLNIGATSSKYKPAAWTNLAVFFQPTDRWVADSLFVIQAPDTALRLSLQALQTSSVSRPITSVICDQRRCDLSVIDQLPIRDTIVVSDGREEVTLELARTLGSRFLSSHDMSWINYPGRPPVVDIRTGTLSHIRRWATPWDQWTAGRRPTQTTPVTVGYSSNSWTYLQPASSERPMFQSLPAVPAGPKEARWPTQIEIDGNVVIERDGVWLDAQSGDVVLNAIVRIDSVQKVTPHNRRVSGHILFPATPTLPSQFIPFCTEWQGKAKLFSTLQAVCRTHGRELVFKRRWDRCSLKMACAFQLAFVALQLAELQDSVAAAGTVLQTLQTSA